MSERGVIMKNKKNNIIESEIKSIEQILFKREAKVTLIDRKISNKLISIKCSIADNENRKISCVKTCTDKNKIKTETSISCIQECFKNYLSEIAKERVNERENTKNILLDSYNKNLDEIITHYTDLCKKNKDINILKQNQKEI